MSVKSFIDTNVFIYLYSEDEEWRCERVYEAIRTYSCVTSTQVLNEFSNVCLKKLGMPVAEVRAAVEEIADSFPVVPTGIDTIQQALTIREKYGYSYYDCLILAAALASNCKYLLTEDMADGQLIDTKLQIRNIFN